MAFKSFIVPCCFNTQPRGGGCINGKKYKAVLDVSTHSRAEAAAVSDALLKLDDDVSTHSRAEAAAPYLKKQEKSAY